MTDLWFSASELAGQPEMPTTSRGVKKRSAGWKYRPRSGRGGGLEYSYDSLPPATQQALLRRIAAQSPISSSAAGSLPLPAAVLPSAPVAAGPFTPAHQLKNWQRRTAEARAAIVAEIKRTATMYGTENAVRAMIQMAATGTLPAHLQPLVAVANAKAGLEGSRALSRSSIYRWLKDSEAGFTGMAPKTRDETSIPPWAPVLLSLWQQPQKPALAAALDKLCSALPPHILPPSYSQARRFLTKMSARDREAGRMGPREHKNIRAYVARDTSHMWPDDAYTADGHTFDAEVAHPAHGRAFRPEITTVLSISTRVAVGFSVGLAESTWAVMDALSNACQRGVPAIFYVDNGSGYKNAVMDCEVTGLLARLGIEMTNSLPYNSQARGIIERFHKTVWVAGAKELPTYMGAPMDREAKQKVFKLTRADIRASGTSRLLMPWAEFIGWCQARIDAYNHRPHRGLQKIHDTETGKLRYQTPQEAWNAALAEGWQPHLPEDSGALFHPWKPCTTRRALVTLHSNTYFHPDLEHYHGETVHVGYDIRDASQVWVHDLEGRLICIAKFEGNKRSYFPQSFIDQAAEKRAKARIKRAEARIEEAEAELDAPLLLEHAPAGQMSAVAVPKIFEPVPLNPTEHLPEGVVTIDQRPMFETDPQKYRWLMRNKRFWTREDATWLLDYVAGFEFELLLRRYADEGIAFSGDDGEMARKLEQAGVSAN